MKILITTPSLNIHGGIRVLVEWANHLARRGHDVTFQVWNGTMRPPNNWIEIDKAVFVRPGGHVDLNDFDIAVAGCPPIANQLDPMPGCKKFFLLQMAEHLFNSSPGWVKTCRASYQVQMPIIGISKWVEEEVRVNRGNRKMYYIGNGVSEHFKPGKKAKELTVLVEGWESGPNGYKNPAKDTEYIGARVAEVLKKEYGARIIAFSQYALQGYSHVPDVYEQAPGTDKIAKMYQEAHFMVKASKYDARSCAPVEAMACGTPTVRGIDRGDDDLQHLYNCFKVKYDFDAVLEQAKRLIEDSEMLERFTKNGLEYRKQFLSWDYWMGEVEKIFAE